MKTLKFKVKTESKHYEIRVNDKLISNNQVPLEPGFYKVRWDYAGEAGTEFAIEGTVGNVTVLTAEDVTPEGRNLWGSPAYITVP